MNNTPKKCCEEPAEAKFCVLVRSNSFESSLRNYNSPKLPVLQEKHHRKEYCHPNCSRPYDKTERILHYTMVRQQEMFRSRQRVREVSRSRDRKIAHPRPKLQLKQMLVSGELLISRTQRDDLGQVVARRYDSNEKQQHDNSNVQADIPTVIAEQPLVKAFESEQSVLAVLHHESLEQLFDIPEEPFVSIEPIVVKTALNTEGEDHQVQTTEISEGVQTEQSKTDTKPTPPTIAFEQTHLTIGMDNVRYKISLRILHNLFLKTASLTQVVASIIKKRPALATLRERLHNQLLVNASRWQL